MKWSRIRKLTWKLVLVYAVAVVLVAFSDPDPRSPLFWTGIALAVLGQAVRIWAAGHLRKNQRLTTTGPYARVKNPLYVGTFLIMTGFCLVARGGRYGHWALNHMNWLLLAAGILVFALYYVPYKKKREGDRLRGIFGEDWDLYDRNVPDYFPRWTAWAHPRGEPVRWTFRTVIENSEHWTPFALGACLLAMMYSGRILELVRRVG